MPDFEPTPADAELIEADELAQAVADQDRHDILWLRALPAVLEGLRGIAVEDEKPLSSRVLLAIDRALIAACERLSRISRRDLPVDKA